VFPEGRVKEYKAGENDWKTEENIVLHLKGSPSLMKCLLNRSVGEGYRAIEGKQIQDEYKFKFFPQIGGKICPNII
jgi:hypothetical protein